MVKVSVIVPIYNAEKYLKQCLDSIVNQTLKEIEIILIDDGSTDGSAQICKKYLNDERVSYYHKENEGLAAARDDGMLRATGEYIGFVDADDWLEPDLYQHAYALATQYDVDLVQWGYYMTMPEEKDALYFGSSTEGFYLGDEAKLKFLESKPHWPPVWRRLYKASIIKNNNILKNIVRKVYYNDNKNNISTKMEEKYGYIQCRIKKSC